MLDPETLDYNETQSALHEALEADLSAMGWPGGSKHLLERAFTMLDTLISLAETK